ncbi:hypothetical protein [Naasia aerilata]|uniref:hypothetical protein n=1 Tax=Naasia aerilata TaxID=1162966 RepID=UPI002574167E|nr:hypothetical protein [Naasia aerilata]
MHFTSKRAAAFATVAVAAVALSACSGGASGSSGGGSTPSTDLKVGSIDLKAAGCPATIVVQTDWVPESEHGHLYQMIAGDYTIDASKKSASGPSWHPVSTRASTSRSAQAGPQSPSPASPPPWVRTTRSRWATSEPTPTSRRPTSSR